MSKMHSGKAWRESARRILFPIHPAHSAPDCSGINGNHGVYIYLDARGVSSVLCIKQALTASRRPVRSLFVETGRKHSNPIDAASIPAERYPHPRRGSRGFDGKSRDARAQRFQISYSLDIQ